MEPVSPVGSPMEQFALQLGEVSRLLTSFEPRQQRVALAATNHDLDTLEAELQEQSGEPDPDPFGVREWWKKTCPETVQRLNRIQEDQEQNMGFVGSVETDVLIKLQDCKAEAEEADAAEWQEWLQGLRDQGLESLKHHTERLAQVVDGDQMQEQDDILRGEELNDSQIRFMTPEQKSLAQEEAQSKREKTRFLAGAKLAKELLAGGLPMHLDQVQALLAKAHQAQQIGEAAAKSQTQTSEELEQLTSYIQETESYIQEGPLRVARETTVENMESCREAAMDALQNAALKLKTLVTSMLHYEAQWWLEEKLRAEVARGRESVPAAQTAKDLAADAAKLTLVEAGRAGSSIEEAVEAAEAALRPRAQGATALALGNVLLAQHLLKRLDEDKAAEISSKDKALQRVKQQVQSLTEKLRQGQSWRRRSRSRRSWRTRWPAAQRSCARCRKRPPLPRSRRKPSTS
ncbi:unnamed protein product [Effrenium voratum]|nr:unnamed protein product [Effrenium voratum]